MSGPLVSVILPTYNRARYLPDAVQSVLRQTETRWELLLADDGSTDATPEYLATLTDPRIRILKLTHAGHPEAVRNQALAHARGRYVAFLDSDDWWEPEKLALQLAALEARPGAEWSYTRLRGVDEDGQEFPVYTRRPFVPHEGMILDRLIAGEAMAITSTVMAERAVLERLGGFDVSLTVGSDFELWVRLAAVSPVASVAKPVVTRRRHPRQYGAAHHDMPEVIEEIFHRLISHARSPAARRSVMRRRARWLVKMADRRRAERRVDDAVRFLRAASPQGLKLPAWWISAIRTLPLIMARAVRAA